MSADRYLTVVDPRVSDLCREFDIKIIGKHQYPMPGETRAVATIRRLIDKHGEAHARLVLCVLAEGRGNHALIDEMSLTAVSSLFLACSDIVENRTSEVLDLFDKLPMGPMMAMANELRGFVHQGNALAGMIYLQLHRLRQGRIADHEAAARRYHAATDSELDKGRARFVSDGRHLRPEEKLPLGRELLEIKAKVPRGHWGPWLRDSSGVSPGIAIQAMRLARAEAGG